MSCQVAPASADLKTPFPEYEDRALLEQVFAKVREFTGGRFTDDATLITIAIR